MAEVLMALFEREQARRDLYSDCLQAALWLLMAYALAIAAVTAPIMTPRKK